MPEASPPRKLVMVCPTLKDEGGHEYDYTRAVAEAAISDAVQVTTIIPSRSDKLDIPGKVIRTEIADRLPTGSLMTRLMGTLRMIKQYQAIFRMEKGKAEVLWFFHSISPNQILIIMAAWLLSASRQQKIVFFLRQVLGQGRLHSLLLYVMGASASGNPGFVTDSELIADDVLKRTGRSIRSLPIPVHLPEKRKSGRKTCTYFGARRLNKGYTKLPAIVQMLQAHRQDIDYVIQSYAHRDDAAIPELDSALQQLKQLGVEIIDQAVSTEQFNQMVADCDLALIPYESSIYSHGTSGNFVASVCARSVVLVTDGTWMAHITKQHDLSRVILLPDATAPDQLEEVVQRATALLDKTDVPSAAERLWCSEQTVTQLWAILRHEYN